MSADGFEDMNYTWKYLIGPVSGIEDCNRPAFGAARAKLQKDDDMAIVMTPFDNPDEEAIADALRRGKDTVGSEHWRRVMKQMISECLLQADEVWALPGWKDSRGATIEALVAVTIGVPLYELESGKPIRLVDVAAEWDR